MATMEDDNLFGLEPDQVSSLLEQESQQQVAQDYRGNPINQAGANLGRLFGNILFGNVMGMQRPEVQMAMRMQQMKMGVEQDAMNQGIDAMSDPEQFNKLVVKHALAANLPQIAYKAAINARGLELNRRSIQAKEKEAQAMADYRMNMGVYYGGKNQTTETVAEGHDKTKLAVTAQQGANAASVADIRGNHAENVAQINAQGQRDRGATAAQIRAQALQGGLGKLPTTDQKQAVVNASADLASAGISKWKDNYQQLSAASWVANKTLYFQSIGVKDRTQARSMAINAFKQSSGYKADTGEWFGGGAGFDPAAQQATAPSAPALPSGWSVKVK